ncbi:MAG: ABC transporter permease [Synergistaceae bacterium]|jgi:ribose/xylose/arabinose/galactoside ABC-type transport system permease subunit|nr:ABC transporter permease [Synergistaceae bacterium]
MNAQIHQLKARFLRQEYIVTLFTIMVVFVFSVLPGSNFYSLPNFRIILSQAAINGICVIGLTLCLIMGGIDFSMGAVLAVCACFSGILVNRGVPVFAVLAASVLTGMLCGAANGFLIAYLRIAPIIATLASMYVLRGLCAIATGGVWISDFPETFKWPGQSTYGGIPMHFVLWLVLAFAVQFTLNNFNIGRKFYAAGGNPESARLFGIDYAAYRLSAYAASGALIGLSGTIYASMVGTVSADTTGLNTSGDLLAAALIGGVHINGGKGNVFGAGIGVLLMRIIRNGLIISKISEHWADAVTGAIIVLALVLSSLEKFSQREQGG